MQFLDRKTCPIHTSTTLIYGTITMGDVCFGKHVRETLRLKNCPECMWEQSKLYINNYVHLIYYNKEGSEYKPDELIQEGIAINDINISVGFHYYSSDVEVNAYKMREVFTMDFYEYCKNPNKHRIAHFALRYPNDIPQLINMEKLYRLLKLDCLAESSIKELISQYSFI